MKQPKNNEVNVFQLLKIGTSPMYVLKSIVENNGGIHNVNSDFIIGSLS